MAVEYTVRPVVRYFVTRWEDGRAEGSAWNTGSSYCGTFDNVEQANRVAEALAQAEVGASVRLLGSNTTVTTKNLEGVTDGIFSPADLEAGASAIGSVYVRGIE